MRVTAADAMHSFDSRANCTLKFNRNLALLSSTRPELGHCRRTEVIFFVGLPSIEESVHAAKQNSVPQLWQPTVLHLWFVLRDQELAGSACSEQLDSYKDRGDHHSVNAIYSNSVDWMQIRQCLASRPAEGNVSADFPHCAARLDSSHYMSSRQMLMLKTYLRLRENSYFVQPAQDCLRQRQRCERKFCFSTMGLLHDRDTKFCESFRELIESGSVKPIRLPARSPNLNSYAERWVRSVKEECLAKLILVGESSLRRALQQYLLGLP